MSERYDRFEHLMTRCLDGEASPGERRELARWLRDDPTARAMYEQTCEIDALASRAMRAGLAEARRAAVRSSGWVRVGRALILATAASVAAFAWLRPDSTDVSRDDRAPAHAGLARLGSWFAPAQPAHDMIEPTARDFERPELRVRGGERQWIVLPGAESGQFVVIEVERVRTHVIGLHQDL